MSALLRFTRVAILFITALLAGKLLGKYEQLDNYVKDHQSGSETTFEAVYSLYFPTTGSQDTTFNKLREEAFYHKSEYGTGQSAMSSTFTRIAQNRASGGFSGGGVLPPGVPEEQHPLLRSEALQRHYMPNMNARGHNFLRARDELDKIKAQIAQADTKGNFEESIKFRNQAAGKVQEIQRYFDLQARDIEAYHSYGGWDEHLPESYRFPTVKRSFDYYSGELENYKAQMESLYKRKQAEIVGFAVADIELDGIATADSINHLLSSLNGKEVISSKAFEQIMELVSKGGKVPELPPIHEPTPLESILHLFGGGQITFVGGSETPDGRKIQEGNKIMFYPKRKLPPMPEIIYNKETTYVLSTHIYKDEEKSVNMEIIKVATYSDAGPTNVDATLGDILNFKGANIDAASGKIEIVMAGDDENFLINSDLQSLTNFNAQKQIEAMVIGIPIAATYNTEDAEYLGANFHGLDNAEPGKARVYISVVLDFLPFIGTGKALGELIFGIDPVTGQEVSRIAASFAVVGSFVPVPGVSKAGKFLGKAISKAVAEEGEKLTIGAVREISTFTKRLTRGVATGGHNLRFVKEGDVWLHGTHQNAGKVPGQIAEKLRGQKFRNWDDFRQKFWKEVADDPILSKDFDPRFIGPMRKNGIAPEAPIGQWTGRVRSYQLHHAKPIHDGGSVYDFDNIYVVTPKFHNSILDPAYHFKKN